MEANEEILTTEYAGRIDEVVREVQKRKCLICRSKFSVCRNQTGYKKCRKFEWGINYDSQMGMWYFRLFYGRKVWVVSHTTKAEGFGPLLLDVLEKINEDKEKWVEKIINDYSKRYT